MRVAAGLLLSLGLLSAQVTQVPAPASNGSGTVTEAKVQGTSNTVAVSGTCDITSTGTCTLTVANPFVVPGKITLHLSGSSAASLNMPSGTAPSAPVSGDLWNLSGVPQFYNGSATKSLAFLDSATTGNELPLTFAAGLSRSSNTITTDSSTQAFLKSGALTCGASTNGKMLVHTTPLQYCDNAGTPALRYAAYGSSAGVASSAAALSAAYVDWNASSGGASILNKPTLAASATTDTTDASNISSGTLGAARLPNVPVTISTSGAVSDPGGSSDYQFNNASGALTFNAPAGVAGLQRCYRNATGKSGAITIQMATSNTVDLNGANGSSAGTLVSGGALGDAVCIASDAANHWYAYVQKGVWTNN